MKEINQIQLKPIKKIGVSKIGDLLKCPLKVVFDNSINFTISNPNPIAILGSVMHKMMELDYCIKSENDFEKEWEKELERLLSKYSDYEKKNYLFPFEWKCRFYHPKKNIIKRIILDNNEVKENKKKSSSNLLKKEKGVSSKFFTGYIDHYEERGKLLIIKDYKSGNIYKTNKFDDYRIKPEYVNQVKLYADIALKRNPKLKSIKLFIINSSGKEISIASTLNECQELLNTSENLIRQLNLEISEGTIYKKASRNEICVYCQGRIHCPYFNEFLSTGINNKSYDVVGKIISNNKTNKGYNLTILTKNNEQKEILNVSSHLLPSNFKNILLGKELVFFNLYKNKNTNSYYCNNSTTIFKLNS